MFTNNTINGSFGIRRFLLLHCFESSPLIVGALLALLIGTAGSAKAQIQPGDVKSHIDLGGSAAQPGPKKLIEWGFDQPNTARLRANISRMEQSPFDGVVLAAYGSGGGKTLDLAWQAWGHAAFTREQFASAVADLKATTFHKFTDNFLRLNVTPGDVDWFDDAGWSGICANANLAGWICREGGLKGIMFDTEQYDKKHRPFSWGEMADHETHSFESYRDQARKRGREFGGALSAEKPDITVLLTYANTFQVIEEKAPQKYSTQALLPPFIDGLLEGLNKRAIIVDALELAYGARDRNALSRLRKAVSDAGRFSLTRNLYKSRMQVGFGLWLDKDWQQNGWDPANLTKNYFQPQQFGEALSSAIDLSDRYVWIYTEKVDWWKNTGISPLYVDAIDRARARR